MSVYKEPKTNTWRVIYRYTDWKGERKQSQKRGFPTKREALAWEQEQKNRAASDLDMTFESGHEGPYQGEHLGHERAYHSDKTSSLLRQAEDVRHTLERGHGVAE